MATRLVVGSRARGVRKGGRFGVQGRVVVVAQEEGVVEDGYNRLAIDPVGARSIGRGIGSRKRMGGGSGIGCGGGDGGAAGICGR